MYLVLNVHETGGGALVSNTALAARRLRCVMCCIIWFVHVLFILLFLYII
jgi:hypothetical protein